MSARRRRRFAARAGVALLAAVLVASFVTSASAAPPAGSPATSEARLLSFRLRSELVDGSKPGIALEADRTVPKVNVLLPAGYRDHPDRRYPVLWLLHGANGGTDTWVPGIRQLAEGLRAIVVMPDGGRFGMYMDWWRDGARRDPAWATYHLRVLRAEVERRYRIRPGRRWHAIAGISMGGQGALRYAALLPGYFGSVATFSAAFPDMQAPVTEAGVDAFGGAGGAGDSSYTAIFGPRDDAYAEGNNPLALAPNYGHTRMYLTSGDGTNCSEDPVTPNIGLDATTETLLHEQQAPFAAAVGVAGADVTEVTTCGVHTFGVWDRAFAAARAWEFFAPVPEHPRDWEYRTDATAGDMWGFRFRFEDPPTAVATFTRSDRTIRATGTGRVVISRPGGCRLEARLPFERTVPTACLRSG